MGSRLKLHEELCAILGTNRAYFQPPASVKMNYPCIRYSLSAPDVKRANDGIYRNTDKYEVTVIDPNPDSTIYRQILEHFQMCRVDRMYKSDNLNHFTLTLFY